MDRNATAAEIIRRVAASLSARRAWIEIRITPTPSRLMRSLSARRAWIEIVLVCRKPSRFVRVALRKESVDRNFEAVQIAILDTKSLSARRAWIEIYCNGCSCCYWYACRSPQGEHGMFLFLTVQGGFVHANIRFNFENCYSKNSRIK